MDRSFSQKPLCWRSDIAFSLRVQAIDAVRLVAKRLCKPEEVRDLVKIAEEQSPYFRWAPTSLAFGYPGLALFFLFLSRCFPDEGWFAIAQQYVQLAADATQQQPFTHAGIFLGSAGMALAVSSLYQDDQRYLRIYKTLNLQLVHQIQTIARPEEGETEVINPRDYDVMTGVAGTLAYLLSVKNPDQPILEAIQSLLAYLIRLANLNAPQTPNRWYIPPERLMREELQMYPSGYSGCGLAHGIAGPLAVLALAWRAGYRQPDLKEAIIALAGWLVENHIRDEWGINWPIGIAPNSFLSQGAKQKIYPARAAWCHGAPGIARALDLASTALHDSMLHRLAGETLETLFLRSPLQRRDLGPIFCHGKSGILSICLHFAYESRNERIHDKIPSLIEDILEQFNPSFRFGFQNTDDGYLVDDPTLLHGACGIANTLLAAITSVVSPLDRAFLLA